MKFTLPYPPSANRYWRNFRGRMVVSEVARQYKTEVGWTLKAAQCEAIGEPVRITLHVYRPQRRGDLDNTLKVLLDACNGIAYNDDSQIQELHAILDDDKERPRVEVEIMPMGTK